MIVYTEEEFLPILIPFLTSVATNFRSDLRFVDRSKLSSLLRRSTRERIWCESINLAPTTYFLCLLRRSPSFNLLSASPPESF